MMFGSRRARHEQARRYARESVQQRAHRGPRLQPPLGQPVSESLGNGRWRGTFFDIWTPSTFAQAGMLVSNTTTEGRIYEMSSEHHVRHEIQLHEVSNWQYMRFRRRRSVAKAALRSPLRSSAHPTLRSRTYSSIASSACFSLPVCDRNCGLEKYQVSKRAHL